MKIDHIAIWTQNLEELRVFYMKYFNATSNEKYVNPTKKFSSYFLSFEGDCSIEIMEMPGIPNSKDDILKQFLGLIHFAIKVKSKTEVDQLTEELRSNNYKIIGEPRTTGDGCYESVILDPDGNRVEIVA
jgi:lactoylglutathione lyase